MSKKGRSTLAEQGKKKLVVLWTEAHIVQLPWSSARECHDGRSVCPLRRPHSAPSSHKGPRPRVCVCVCVWYMERVAG